MGCRGALRAGNDAALRRLVDAYGRIYERLREGLRALEADMLAAEAAGVEVSADWLRRQGRYESLLNQVRAELARYGGMVEAELGGLGRSAVGAAERDAWALTRAQLPLIPEAALGTVWNRLPAGAVETMLGFLAEESPLMKKLGLLGEDAAVRVARAMEESVALGYSPRELAVTLRKEAGMKLTDALRMARTTQINAYREASRAAYVANSRLVPTWTWCSALDSGGTCMACVARHGSVHPVSERLNDHDNGWCVMVPNPVSYRDLGLDVDDPPFEAIPTGEAWFKGLGEAEQRAFMPSKAAWGAWQDGKLRVGDFLGSREDDVWGEVIQEISLKGMLGADAKGYYSGGRKGEVVR